MITDAMSQFVIAVTSSMTTAILLWILRQFVKLRKAGERHMREHRYLMMSMGLVLSHLGLQALADEVKNEP